MEANWGQLCDSSGPAQGVINPEQPASGTSSKAVAFGSERMAAAGLDGRSRGGMAPAGSGDLRIQTEMKEGCETRASTRLQTSRMDAGGNGLPCSP